MGTLALSIQDSGLDKQGGDLYPSEVKEVRFYSGKIVFIISPHSRYWGSA